ncbi:DUF7144 family membrane protein [Streptomyces longispororuber]|uniref:DUF7144 family membrane protein n=1 Tax=Streptomyces longispororuber TaxID=68230 RepID=UPI00210E9BC1|nr:hypothetical protein [Streptomyces longispororuber]MCQ4212564.1 hypothetical protein [Streptomyces longispororuber]
MSQTTPNATPDPGPDPAAWSTDHRKRTPDPTRGDGAGSGWATGGMVFAGVLMLVSGALGILNGISGIARDDVYGRVGDYLYSFDLTTWGWIHLVVGILVAVTGWGILKGSDWARGAGIGLAALYIVEYFMFLPYAPIWSVVSIGIGVFVIWALATDTGGSRRTA